LVNSHASITTSRHERSNRFAHDDFEQVAGHRDVEDDDWDVSFPTQRKRRRVHDFHAQLYRFREGNLVKSVSVGIKVRVTIKLIAP